MNELEIDILRRLIERSVRNVIVQIDAEQRHHLRDFTNAPEEEVIEYFYSELHTSVYNTRYIMERRFYVGVTDNIMENLKHHHINSYMCCCRVSDFETASRILRLLNENLGIHTGPLPPADTHPEILNDHTILYLTRRDAPGFID
ncbi:MAG: hypothetical protein K2F87_02505 [Muribaculaceae bacterium]|nr:hypothetical protein [Muribaculaceae bacterium]